MEDGINHSALRFDPSQRLRPPHVRPIGDKRARRVISVVIPAMNEAASLPQLVREIVTALRPLVAHHRLGGFEIVLVDDGSTDATLEVASGLLGDHHELRSIRLSRNVGQSAATAAGFRHARGDYVATLDADLQNVPADLVVLWDALQQADQADCVALGWRMNREDAWSKRMIGRCANRVRNLLFGQEIRDTGCSVRIIPREAALRLPVFHGCHRFYGSLLLREGCSIVQVPVRHRRRSHGTSHYNLWNRSLRVVVDLFGVAWLLRREARYEIASMCETRHFEASTDFQKTKREVRQEV